MGTFGAPLALKGAENRGFDAACGAKLPDLGASDQRETGGVTDGCIGNENRIDFGYMMIKV
eukprot:scaffold3725_cov105-Pinguiococcus_pyrenoidosus.AAC.1